MPTESTTTNNAFRYPTAANNGSNFATGLADMATDVDAMWLSGTLAGRPAAAKANRRYYATDTGAMYMDTGSAWDQLTYYASGTEAAKPAAAAASGEIYLATDSNSLYYSDGTTWRTIYGSRGATNIATSESRTNTAYGTLATPDQVAGIVLPTNGLIQIWYQAMWQESVQNAAQAAIFIGANQLKAADSGTFGGANPATQGASISGSLVNANYPLISTPIGLASVAAGSGYGGDVTTGQVVGGLFSGNGVGMARNGSQLLMENAQIDALGGPCYVFAAAGTYTVSVQFKASSGSVTASNRKLWVQALPFS